MKRFDCGPQFITQWNLDIMKGQELTKLFAITRFPYIEVLFIYFAISRVKENRGLRKLKVRYIEVSLYSLVRSFAGNQSLFGHEPVLF